MIEFIKTLVIIFAKELIIRSVQMFAQMELIQSGKTNDCQNCKTHDFESKKRSIDFELKKKELSILQANVIQPIGQFSN